MLPRSLRCIARQSLPSTRPLLVHKFTAASLLHKNLQQKPCLAGHRPRNYSTPPPQINASDLPLERYHYLSDITMDRMIEQLEDLLDDFGDDSFEVEYHSGVLTLKVGKKDTYVVNKQPPNKQIWLSSPVSGPSRYDYSATDDTWRNARNGQSLNNLLNTELSEYFDEPVVLRLGTAAEEDDS